MGVSSFRDGVIGANFEVYTYNGILSRSFWGTFCLLIPRISRSTWPFPIRLRRSRRNLIWLRCMMREVSPVTTTRMARIKTAKTHNLARTGLVSLEAFRVTRPASRTAFSGGYSRASSGANGELDTLLEYMPISCTSVVPTSAGIPHIG